MLGIAFGFARSWRWRLGGDAGAVRKRSILIDADSGKVLRAENATYPWYPASITKLMTLYITLERAQGPPHHLRHAVHRLAQRQ